MPNNWNTLLGGLLQGASNVGSALIAKSYQDEAKRQYNEAVDYLKTSYAQVLEQQKALLLNTSADTKNAVTPTQEITETTEPDLTKVPYSPTQKRTIVPEAPEPADVLSNLFKGREYLLEQENKKYLDPLQNLYKKLFEEGQIEPYVVQDANKGTVLIDKNSGRKIAQIFEPDEEKDTTTLMRGDKKYQEKDGKYYRVYPQENKGKIVGYQYDEISKEEYERATKTGEYKPKRGGYGGKYKAPKFEYSEAGDKVSDSLKLIGQDNVVNQGTNVQALKDELHNAYGWSYDKINKLAEDAYNFKGTDSELQADITETIEETEDINEAVDKAIVQMGIQDILNKARLGHRTGQYAIIEWAKDIIYNRILAENYDKLPEDMLDPLYDYVNQEFAKLQ